MQYKHWREGFRTNEPLSGLLVYNFIFPQSIAVEVVFQWFLTLFSNRWQRWRVLDSHSGLGISRKSLLQLIKLFLERCYSHESSHTFLLHCLSILVSKWAPMNCQDAYPWTPWNQYANYSCYPLYIYYGTLKRIVQQSRASWVCNYFLFSHELDAWFGGSTVGRN